MRILGLTVPLALLVLAAAAPVAAQGRTIIVVVSAGTETMPRAYAPCGGSWGSIHGAVGVEQGMVGLEARLGRQMLTTISDCALVPPSNGVHFVRLSELGEGTTLITEMRGKFLIPSLLMHVGAGAGLLLEDDIPYALVHAGLRTPGAIRISLDVEPHWYRIPFTALEGEWQQGQLVRTISSEEGREWQRTTAFRVSIGMTVR